MKFNPVSTIRHVARLICVRLVTCRSKIRPSTFKSGSKMSKIGKGLSLPKEQASANIAKLPELLRKSLTGAKAKRRPPCWRPFKFGRLRLFQGAVAFFSAFCACACYGRVVASTCTCFCGVLPQHIPVGCEHFVVVGLARKEADTMTPRDYKSCKSTRLGPERVLSLHLRC
jgi:hypothetical protein